MPPGCYSRRKLHSTGRDAGGPYRRCKKVYPLSFAGRAIRMPFRSTSAEGILISTLFLKRPRHLIATRQNMAEQLRTQSAALGGIVDCGHNSKTGQTGTQSANRQGTRGRPRVDTLGIFSNSLRLMVGGDQQVSQVPPIPPVDEDY